METWIITPSVIMLYLIVAFVVGILAGRGRAFSVSEYVVGERKFGVIITLFLTAGTWFSVFASHLQ